MKRKTIISISISLAFYLFSITGLSLAADKALIEAAKKEGELVIYTAFARRFLPEIGDLFKKMYNLGDDFNVRFTRKGTGATIQMVEAEYMSGRSNWDVVMQSNESAFLRWIDRGMLLKYQPPNIGNLKYIDSHGTRVAAQGWIGSVVIHNKRVPEKDYPKTYADVLDPKWKGRIGLSNPATAGPAVMFTRFILDFYGWDFFRKLGRNQPIITKGNSAVEQLILSGEIDLGICPNEHSIAMRIKTGDPDLKLLYPGPKTGFYIHWTAINKDSSHPNAAKLWLEFTASDKRQKYVADNAGRYIISKNVTSAIPRPDLKLHPVDWEWIKVHKNEMDKKFIEEIQIGREEG
jgi:iron(III) transport system substrate-binding protein